MFSASCSQASNLTSSFSSFTVHVDHRSPGPGLILLHYTIPRGGGLGRSWAYIFFVQEIAKHKLLYMVSGWSENKMFRPSQAMYVCMYRYIMLYIYIYVYISPGPGRPQRRAVGSARPLLRPVRHRIFFSLYFIFIYVYHIYIYIYIYIYMSFLLYFLFYFLLNVFLPSLCCARCATV